MCVCAAQADRAHGHLLAYYSRHGGREVQGTFLCSPGSSPPPSVKIEHDGTNRDAQADLDRAWQRVLRNNQGRWGVRRAVRSCVNVAKGVPPLAQAATVATVLLVVSGVCRKQR